MVERKDIEERYAKRVGNPDFGGSSNWDTREVALAIDSDESLYAKQEAWSKNFNRKLRDGTFNEEKAKEALKKYLLKEVKKKYEEEYGDYDLDINQVNMDELLDDTILMNDPLPPRKKDYVPTNLKEMDIKMQCENKNMDYVPGYRKDDGTWVKGYCRHTRFTEYMREKERR